MSFPLALKRKTESWRLFLFSTSEKNVFYNHVFQYPFPFTSLILHDLFAELLLLSTYTNTSSSIHGITGSLFRFDSDLSRHCLRTNVTIPNGIGWSHDQKTFYFTHSLERRIYAFDYDPVQGGISNERVFYQHPPTEGEPDGFKLDEEGFLWLAIWGEGRVLRISPEGKLVGQIRYPTRFITCPVFIGTELWVTSAADDDDKGDARSKEYGGALFKVDVGIAGKKEFKFKLDTGV